MIREWDAGINPGHSMGLLPGHPGGWRPQLARRAWTSSQLQHKEGTSKMHGCSFSKAAGSTGAFGDGRWTKMSTGKAESSQHLCPLRAARQLQTWLTLKLHCDKLLMPRGCSLSGRCVRRHQSSPLTGQFKRYPVSRVADRDCDLQPQAKGASKANSQRRNRATFQVRSSAKRGSLLSHK